MIVVEKKKFIILPASFKQNIICLRLKTISKKIINIAELFQHGGISASFIIQGDRNNKFGG